MTLGTKCSLYICGIVHYCEVLNVPYTYRGDLVTHRIKSPLLYYRGALVTPALNLPYNSI